jgi:hypothetical protein
MEILLGVVGLLLSGDYVHDEAEQIVAAQA